LRLYLGWSLEGPCCEEEPAAHTQPLTIRHYFLAMTTVAAALALVRWHGTAGIDPVEFAAVLSIWVIVGAIGCLATVPVAMLLLLRDRTWPSGLALFTLYMVLLASLPLEGAIVLNWGSNHWLGAYELAMFYLPFLAWGTGVGVSMAVARLAGYRLRTGARRLYHGQKVCGGPQE
jgi:hypothetical protein